MPTPATHIVGIDAPFLFFDPHFFHFLFVFVVCCCWPDRTFLHSNSKTLCEHIRGLKTVRKWTA